MGKRDFVFAILLALYSVDSNASGATIKNVNYDGVDETSACGVCSPPDTHGAVGTLQYVQVVNQRVRVYSKTLDPATGQPSLLSDHSLADFFTYQAQGLFDPRVVFDPAQQRWIITAEAFPESATVQYHFIGVSQTDDATANFFVYRINVNFFPGSFWDFPQVGFNNNAVIVTGNVFNGTSGPFAYSAVLSFYKPDLYGGTATYRTLSNISDFSLAPPIVVDNNTTAYLISAPMGGGTILKLYALEDAGIIDNLVGPIDLAVSNYLPPYRGADQAGTNSVLDAGDARFVNASLQKVNALWQIHTVGNGGYLTPRFYLIDLAQKTVAWTHLYFASSSSDDFNASVTADTSGSTFVTWTSTDPNNGTQAQARFAGTDVLGPTYFTGSAAYTSISFYSPTGGSERWGDYSAVTIDPVYPYYAWCTNEIVRTTSGWGSRIFNIGIP